MKRSLVCLLVTLSCLLSIGLCGQVFADDVGDANSAKVAELEKQLEELKSTDGAELAKAEFVWDTQPAVGRKEQDDQYFDAWLKKALCFTEVHTTDLKRDRALFLETCGLPDGEKWVEFFWPVEHSQGTSQFANVEHLFGFTSWMESVDGEPGVEVYTYRAVVNYLHGDTLQTEYPEFRRSRVTPGFGFYEQAFCTYTVDSVGNVSVKDINLDMCHHMEHAMKLFTYEPGEMYEECRLFWPMWYPDGPTVEDYYQ